MAQHAEPGEARPTIGAPPRRSPLGGLTAGGSNGNEALTAATGVVLLALLAALGVTIVRIGQLLSVHMFLGMLLLGPVALKMGSTGYRFVRYYAGNAAYRRKGPPRIELRILAPLVVLSTLVVCGTGVALLLVGPDDRRTLLLTHKVSFFVWLAVTAVHVLGHLVDLPAALRADRRTGERPWDDHGSGRGARALAIAGALVGGLVLALLAEPRFGVWEQAHHHFR